jgi:CheY-like chemotaxis protein
MCADIKRALEAGAVEFVQKPVGVPEIQEVLSKYLSGEVGASRPVI